MEVNRLKITYQRNMLIGQLVAVALGVLSAALLLSYDAPEKTRFGAPHGASREMPRGQPYFRSLKPAPVTLQPHRDTFHLPFFASFRIIRDEQVAQAGEFVHAVFSDHDLTRFDPIMDDNVFPQVGTAEGKGSEFPAGTYSDEWFPGERTPPSFSQEAKLLMDVEPEYPPVALSEWIEGEVTVLVLVDATGELRPFPVTTAEGDCYIDTFFVVSETPPDWYFSDAVKKVLPQWKFLPRIEEGAPVQSFMRITYHFCLGISCTRLHIQVMPRERL